MHSKSYYYLYWSVNVTRHCTPHLSGKNSFTIFNWNFLPKINVKDKLKACPNFLANYNWLYYSKSTGKKCSAPLLFRCRFSVLVRKKADREVFVVLSIVSLSSLPILGSCAKLPKNTKINQCSQREIWRFWTTN